MTLSRRNLCSLMRAKRERTLWWQQPPMKPRIALTVGDFNGIGPEVVLRSLRTKAVRESCIPVLIGPANVFLYYAGNGGNRLTLVPFSNRRILRALRQSSRARRFPLYGLLPAIYRRRQVRQPRRRSPSPSAWPVRGNVDAMVTAPVSKQAMHSRVFVFPGQTEMLQHLSKSPHVAMMLVSPTLRVGLVTIHIPLSDVSRALTSSLVIERITVIHSALRQDWGIARPTLAVLGLNPHAGEGGDIGTEEQHVILPALERLRKKGIRLDGPFPADGFFRPLSSGILRRRRRHVS